MNIDKIAIFIKEKRKKLGLTQEELAKKIYVTEKAISRWETGRGTPDISLLIPLSKELNVDVSELLNGEDSKKNDNNIEQLIEYNELNKSNKYNIFFKLTILFYALSIIVFLLYLRFEYNPNIELNYFIRLLFIFISSIFIIIGNKIYSDKYVEKIEDKKKILKLSQIIVFIYYVVLLFNMVMFARYNSVYGYNLIPFKSFINVINTKNIYNIIINIFGNLLIFMPLEYFLIELFKVNRFHINLLLSLIIIIIIELSQLVLRIGVFDIDDIMLCILGMMFFYILYIKIKKIK